MIRRFFMSTILCAASALGVAAHARAAAPVALPCQSIKEFHALDFWTGTWRVTADGKYAGTDVVRALLAHCAVTESWTDADGSHGMSLFYFDSFAQKWHQVWVTDRATLRGGLKNKDMVAVYPDGGIRFAGALPGKPGSKTILDRTTLTPAGPGLVHQLIEYSVDGGSTWKTSFDAMYKRTGP